MTQSPKKTRVIKKYPNRRLYDSAESRYITLNDIRQLVNDKANFVVIDKNTSEDITRSILLQVIAEQECGIPMMSQDFLAQVIRASSGAMQHFVSDYLEHSLNLFSQQTQAQPAATYEPTAVSSPALNRAADTGMNPLRDPMTTLAELAQKNLEFWQAMQHQLLDPITQTPAYDSELPDQSAPA